MAAKVAPITDISLSHHGHSHGAKPQNIRQWIEFNMIHPEHRFKLLWDAFMFTIVLYNVCKIPMTFAFESVIPEELRIVDVITDLLFAVDIALHFVTATRVNGVLYHDLRTARRQYLRTWFIFDVCCVFPLDRIFAPVWFRANRLFRVVLWFRYFDAWEEQASYYRSTLQLLKLLFFLLLSVHWVSCIWNITINHEKRKATGWLPAVEDMEALRADFSMRYMAGAYWGFCVITGYGAFMPHTTLEFTVTFFCNIIGAFLYALTFSNLVSIIANYEASVSQFQDKISALNLEMDQMKLDKNLRSRILDHFKYHYARFKNSHSGLLRELPSYLRAEMNKYRTEEIRRVPLFRECDPMFIDSLLMCLKPQVCCPNEFLVREGEVGSEMFFITSGQVDIIAADGERILATLGESSFFGEFALLSDDAKRKASCRARTYVDLYVLNRHDFDHALKESPEMARQMLRIAEENNLSCKSLRHIVKMHNKEEGIPEPVEPGAMTPVKPFDESKIAASPSPNGTDMLSSPPASSSPMIGSPPSAGKLARLRPNKRPSTGSPSMRVNKAAIQARYSSFARMALERNHQNKSARKPDRARAESASVAVHLSRGPEQAVFNESPPTIPNVAATTASPSSPRADRARKQSVFSVQTESDEESMSVG